MRMVRTSTVLGLCVALSLCSASNAQRAEGTPSTHKPLTLVGGMLIDGSGAPPLRDSVILVRGECIERVGTVGTLQVPSEYERIPTEGMTVLPGLWDMHVHLLYSGHPNPASGTVTPPISSGSRYRRRPSKC
jgi:imidazolonepropionase-like amidohydrolase